MSEILFGLTLFWLIIIGMENTNEYEAGERAIAIIKKCEEQLPRNQKQMQKV